MPWKDSVILEERKSFIEAYFWKEMPFGSLCRVYGISRKTGYKYVNRYKQNGEAGLLDQSRAPKTRANAVGEEIVASLVALRRQYPYWGAETLLNLLRRAPPSWSLPHPSTAHKILKQHDLVKPKKTRQRSSGYESKDMGYYGPNAVWCSDFKGDITFAGESRKPTPLTVADGCSRFLLGCYDLQRTRFIDVKPKYQALFREYGMPDAIRTDGGPPFASVGLCGLSSLAVWWIKLGIVVLRGRPGCPQDNGRLERLHGTMERELNKTDGLTFQDSFDRFQYQYNDIRPHRSLDGKTPGEVYTKSVRLYPKRISDPLYEDMDFLERADKAGRLPWKGNHHYLTKALAKELIGIKRESCDHVSIFFGNVKLGEIKRGKFLPNKPKTRKREKKLETEQ